MKYFYSLIGLVVIVFLGIQDWQMLLVIPFAVLNGYINSIGIRNFRVGKIYHTIQWYILFVAFGILTFFGIYEINESILTVGLYYTFFELSLNLFSGWEWDTVGKSSKIDLFAINNTKTYGQAKLLIFVIKLFLVIGGLAWYSFNIPF